jgi:4-amino-4-deoxy-L-arabinose transferase-like glycosyltransferase
LESRGTDEIPVSPIRRRSRFGPVLGLLMLSALVLSVGYTLVTKAHDDDLLDEGDAFFYGLTAANAANGNWFQDPFTRAPAADHPPLTVVVLVPASFLFDGALPQRLTMCVVGSLTVGAVGLAGREMAGSRVGLLAAAIAVVDPNLWINNALIMSEALAALLYALLLFFAYRLVRSPTVGRAAAAGALCGLLVLTRAETGVFLLLIVVPVLVVARQLDWRGKLLRIGVAALATLAVLTPWSVWVHSQFSRPVLVSTNDGLTLAGANCDETYYTHLIGFWSVDCGKALLDPAKDASQNSAALRTDAWSYVRDHLSRVPTVVVAREGRIFGYWGPGDMARAGELEGRPPVVSWLGFATFWLLAPFAVIGAVQLRRRSITVIPFVATLIAAVSLAALFYGIPRHRIELDVATCVLTSVALVAWRTPSRVVSRTRHPVGA